MDSSPSFCDYAQAGEHERARATARRGLSQIPFEEQQERINLWTVLLRLEVSYGVDDTNTEKTLTEACCNADDFVILTNMADIYQENDMIEVCSTWYYIDLLIHTFW